MKKRPRNMRALRLANKIRRRLDEIEENYRQRNEVKLQDKDLGRELERVLN